MVKRFVSILIVLFYTAALYAQAPGGIPYDNSGAVKFTFTNIIIYVVLPFIIIVAYILIRRRNRQKQRENKND